MTNDTSHIAHAKRQLRNEALTLRDSIDARAQSAADAKIQANLEALPLFKKAKTVFCYIGVGSEVGTLALIEKMLEEGKVVCAPRCVGNSVMYSHAIASIDDLGAGILGIPAPAATTPLILPAEVDLVIVPCVTCDRKGYRIGYGGGYYDYYLADVPAQTTKVILCRESLLADSLPTEPHDIKADFIVTSKEVIEIL